jgi:hypothetical protein
VAVDDNAPALVGALSLMGPRSTPDGGLSFRRRSHTPIGGGWYSQHAAKSPVNPGLHWTWVERQRSAKSSNPDVNGHPRSMTELR